MSATPASISSPTGVGSLLGSLAGLGGSIYGLVNSAGLQGTANSATSNIAAIQAQQLGYANQLQSLMANPSSVSSLPGYQFDLSQGTQAIDRSAAAPGGTGLGSGGEMTALETYGQGLASNFYNQQVQTLSSLSGIPSSASALAQALQTSGAASTGLGSSISGLSGALSNLLNPGNMSALGGALGGIGSGLSSLFGGNGYVSDSQIASDAASYPSAASYLGSSTDAAINSDISNTDVGSIDLGNMDSMFSGFNSAGGQAANGFTPAVGQNPTADELEANSGALTTGINIAPGSTLNASTLFGGAGNALGIYGGVQQGGVVGYTGAALNTGGLATKTGLISPNSDAGTGLVEGGEALGIYQGIKQGGVVGDTSAGINAARLGATTGALPSAIGTAAGYAAIPLALYNFAEDWQSGNTGSDAISGAETGASIGSVVGPLGTLVGGVIGAAAGALSSAFGGGKKDPETTNFNSFVQANAKAGGTLTSQTNPSQAYQLLAGMMDAKNNTAGHSTNLELVFGRMGEGNFMSQMSSQVNSAISSGKIKANASPSTIYSQVVMPWLQSKNAYVPADAIISSNGTKNNGTVDSIITQLIGQWQSGELTGSSKVGVSGQTISGLQTYGA